jgi:NADP-dependent 3-hydroxy acid dehydrogenase YdfG
MSNLKGKVVAITGASSGIGEATARRLAKEGAKVVLGARRTDRLEKIVAEIEAAGGEAAFRALDVVDLEDMRGFVDFAVERFGRLDTLMNNAGVMPLAPLEAQKIDEWNRMIDVNIRGVLHGIAAALPVFKRQAAGHFVNVSSIGGHQVWANCAVYCATKYAVVAISDGLRLENKDVRVTVISPGVTESELANTTTDKGAQEMLDAFREISIPADAIAGAVAYAVGQPDGVDVNEIIVRPTASLY